MTELITALAVAAVFGSGAGKDVAKQVSSPTPAVVTLKPEASGPTKLARAPRRNRPDALEDGDRGLLLLLLLSAPQIR